MVVNRLAELLERAGRATSARSSTTRVVAATPRCPSPSDVSDEDARVRQRAPRGLPRRRGPSRSRSGATRTAARRARPRLRRRDQRRGADGAAASRPLRARRHDRQGRRRAHVRVGAARRARARDRVEVDSDRPGRSAPSRRKRPAARARRAAHARPRRAEARRGVARAGHRVGAGDPGQELQEGLQDARGARRVRSWCSTRRTGRSSRWRRTRRSTRTSSSTASRRRRGSSSTTRPTTTRWSTGRSPASTRRARRSSSSPRSPVLQQRGEHRRQDDRRPREVRRTRRDPNSFFTNDNDGAVRPGRPLPGAHGLERRVLLHDRRRPLLPADATTIPSARRDPGHGPREYGFGGPTGLGLRTRRPGGSPTRRGSSRGPRRRTRKRSRTRTGCPATTSSSAVGQGDVLVTPLQLANAYAAFANGGTLCEPRLASEVRDADRQEDPATSRRSPIGQVPVDRSARTMLAGLRRRGHRTRRAPRSGRSPASRAGSVVGQDRYRAGRRASRTRRCSSA